MIRPTRRVVSIVVPCLNEIDNVENCYRRVVDVFERELTDYDFQLIYCDDGSTDGTRELLRDLVGQDSRVIVVMNARNYGVYRNSFNAMKYATGDALIPMMPVDLQDPPEVIVEFVEKWEKGYEVVAGTRRDRVEGRTMRVVRSLYYRVVTAVGDYPIPPFAGEFQLLDRAIYVDLVSIDDYYPYTRGLIASLSSNRVEVPYTWQAREHGKSKQNLWKLYDQGLNGVVSSTHAPLRLAALVGMACALVGVLFAIVQVVLFLTISRFAVPPGISSILILIAIIGGAILFVLGVLAEYIAAIHSQVRGRSRVRVSEVLGSLDGRVP